MQKLKTKKQMLVYAISGMGVNMLNLMVGSYLCSAVLIGGFGEQAIKNQTFLGHDVVIAAVWSIFVFIAKLIDGIIDIPMASFTDRLRSKYGRRRPAILMGLIPMVISYCLFLIVPQRTGATLLNTIWYGIVLCIFYSTYTLTMVSYYATFTEIVDNENDRIFLSNVKSVCDVVYFVLGYVVVSAMLKGLHINIVSLIVLPMVLTMLIPLFMIKEAPSDGNSENAKTVKLVSSLCYTFKNKKFLIWMGVYFFMTFGVQLFLGGINEYFSFVNMNMMFVMGASFAPVPFALIIYNKLMKRYGFGVAFRYTLITYTLGMASVFFVSLIAPGTLRTALSIVSGIFCSLAMGALFSVSYSVPSQLAAEEEEKTGISNSAMYFAVQGLFSGVATGFATGIVLTALKGTEDSHSTGMLYLTLICAAGTALALVITFFLPKSITSLGKRLKEGNND